MVRHGTWGSSLRHIKPVTLLRFARTSKRNAYLVDLYPQIDSGVISSYHNYASCFFRHDVRQALRSVCYCNITFL